MNPERQSDQQPIFFLNIDGTISQELETIQASINLRSTEGSEGSEAVVENQAISAHHSATEQTIEVPPAIQEERQENNPLEKLMEGFSKVKETNLYSSAVNKAIEIIEGSNTIQETIQAMMDNSAMDFHHLLYRQIDDEGRDLNRFMTDLQRVQPLPAMDIDYI